MKGDGPRRKGGQGRVGVRLCRCARAGGVWLRDLGRREKEEDAEEAVPAKTLAVKELRDASNH